MPEMKKNDMTPQQHSPLHGIRKANIWIVVLLLLLGWLAFSSYFQSGPPTVPYSFFRQQLRQDNVKQVTVQGPSVTGEFRNATTPPAQGKQKPAATTEFQTYTPAFGDDGLLQLLEENNVQLRTRPESEGGWITTLVLLSPLLLLFGLAYMQQKRMGGQAKGLFSIGKSKAKLYDKSKVQTLFEDVAGAEGAKTELMEVVAYLKNPERIERLGGEVPTGMLLVGPPGTGKTLLARAVAGEADVPFYSMSGSDFMEMFVGVGASRVRDLFKDAKKDAPAIVFIDELDSIGRQRGAGLGGGHDEREQTLNQLLSEMDGFEPNQGVIVLSATNRPDILGPALMRPGRFDRRVVVSMPNTKDRKEILGIYARNKPLEEDVDLESLARSTVGFSGADLENLLNEAALLAARDEGESISQRNIEEARDKILMGLQRRGLALTEEEKRMVAYHEAGHAIVAASMPEADPLHKVSIVPRTKAMGVTQQFPEREKYIYPKSYLHDRLAVMLGGRAAEALVFQTETSGAGNDLRQATSLARKMVLEWGMSEAFQHMALGGKEGQVFLGEEIAGRREYSEQTAHTVDNEVANILHGAYTRAMAALDEHRSAMDRLVERLLEEEEVPGDVVMEIIGKRPGKTEPPDMAPTLEPDDAPR